MAKIKCPLMSMDASGLIGQRLVFSRRGSGQQVRIQRAQKDKITESRINQREKYKEAVDSWKLLNVSEKNYWHEKAISKKYTGYNLYIREYLKNLLPDVSPATYGIAIYGNSIYGSV